MDGCCRHVFATLLEILDFREDASSKSVTSGPSLWLKRAKTKEAVLVTELQISSTSCTEDKRPSHDLYSPIHRDVTLPKPQSYFQAVKELLPESCGLDTWEERRAPPLPPAPPLRVRTPTELGRAFLKTENCKCAECFEEELSSSCEDRKKIEEDTRGQATNKNWFEMRKGLITASQVKKVLCSTDEARTAQSSGCL